MYLQNSNKKTSNKTKRKKKSAKRKRQVGAGRNDLTFVQWWPAGGVGATLHPNIYNIFLWTLGSYSILVTGNCPLFK